jgi:hypothetical protein
LPLFQGMRWVAGARFSLSGMVVLLRYKDDECATHAGGKIVSAFRVLRS